MAMNQAQRKHLQERIDNAYRNHRNASYDANKVATPAAVKKAMATVKAWEETLEKAQDAQRKKIRQAKQGAEEALFFEDPAKALKAVRVFETMKFHK